LRSIDGVNGKAEQKNRQVAHPGSDISFDPACKTEAGRRPESVG